MLIMMSFLDGAAVVMLMMSIVREGEFFLCARPANMGGRRARPGGHAHGATMRWWGPVPWHLSTRPKKLGKY